MTRDDVIRMARKAGMSGMLTDVICQFSELERFAALVAAHEREKLANHFDACPRDRWDGVEIACIIRAKGTP